MSGVFQCEVCHYTRPVPEDYAGKKARCPQCAAVVEVPLNGVVQAAEQAKKACPFCAETILADARKCRWCGEVIDRDLAIAKEKERIREIERHQQLMGQKLPGAKASVICGGLSILLSILAPMLGPIAILLGLQALREKKKSPHLEGVGWARAGIVLGTLGIVAFILMIISFKTLFGGGGDAPSD